ncbi:MAG: hypothetical protein IPM97_15360 [Bdellovibrionaceae bacterium]|nr:hypothetical protein [Pseudobdellovibrionaceae bacterium]
MKSISIFFALFITAPTTYAAKMSCGYGCIQWFNKPVSLENLDSDAIKWKNVNRIQLRSLNGTIDTDGVFRFENGRYNNSDLIQKLEIPTVVGKQFYLTTTQPGRCEAVLVCERTE